MIEKADALPWLSGMDFIHLLSLQFFGNLDF
jgi:hypothetical protein